MAKKKDFRAIAIAHMETLGDYARENDISQLDLAEMSELNQGNISRMLSGKFVPRLDNFLKLLDAAGLEIIIQPIKSK